MKLTPEKEADRELLEMAAKAAGYDLFWGITDPMIHCHESEHPGKTHNLWNPLTDDGDALRLLIAIREYEPQLNLACDGCQIETWPGLTQEDMHPDSDYSSIVRRAIVRAAAEIGRSMP